MDKANRMMRKTLTGLGLLMIGSGGCSLLPADAVPAGQEFGLSFLRQVAAALLF